MMADASATGFQVRLLGELELRCGEGPPRALPPSRRTRALLGYLVATGEPQSRSALCDLLWDGTEDPRASLRWSLTKLRDVVDSAATRRLHADRDKVAFDAAACTIDSREVSALLRGEPASRLPLPALERLARALQGEFLEGLELPACYRFHHWWMAERERFARSRRAVLEALVLRLADEPARALPYGRAMVAADPLAEPPHATLVTLLAAAGGYPEAEQHYAYARDLLRREVALPDGGALDDAIRAVRRRQRQSAAARPAEPAASAAATASANTGASATAEATPPSTAPALAATTGFGGGAGPRPSPPAGLVGRDRECRVIDAAIAAPRQAPVLVLLGEPGIGKSRLLDHLGERAAATGRRAIRARCYEAEAVRPYGYWLDALRGVPTDVVDDQVRAALAPLLGGQAAAVSREQLFDAAATLLDALAMREPLAVVVDDLQWIDDASAALLHFVARRLAEPPRPLVFALAARVGEVDDNPAAKGLVQSLARERRLERLELQALDADEVHAWMGDRLGDLGAALRDSGGNPLFLIEMARAAEFGQAAPGQALDTLIGARLHALDEASRDVLGWAAVLGSSFGAERLADVTQLPLSDVLKRVDLLERRGLLKACGDGADSGFDFAHDLVRQAVYRSLSMARRRAQHRQIARALRAASAEDPWLHGHVVHHASLAGDALLGTRAALDAGEHWLRVFANREAAQVAERGLGLIEQVAPDAQRARLEIGLLRLRVRAAAGTAGGRHMPELAERIQRAIDAAQAHALHAEAAGGWDILAYWRQQTGDGAGAHEASLAAARITQRADDLTRCQHLANTGRCLLDIESDGERGRGLIAEAAVLAEALQLEVMELEWGRGLIQRADAQLEAARGALIRAVELGRASANHWREYECMLSLATVELELGRDDDVLRRIEDVRVAAQRMGEAEVPFADALAALARLHRGDADAEAAVQLSLAALRRHDDKARLAYAFNATAAAALARGDHEAARRHADEALAAATAVHRPTQIVWARATLAAAGPARAAAAAGTVGVQP